MTQIAFILLCHKDTEAIIAQANRLTAAGDVMAIHFDARAPAAAFATIQKALKDNVNVVFARKRVKCGWGQWSLVQATLNALEAAAQEYPRATHFYMVSGDCMPIKSAEFIRTQLESQDADIIESVDYFNSNWIKTGMRDERLIYRHYFNERAQKGRFYAALGLQKRLRLARSIPDGLQMMIGSQWWCLRRRTVEWVLEFSRTRRDVMKFFRTTWIPDETFFQTLVRHLVPDTEIRSQSPTFLMFSDYGMPVTFYNDHFDLLIGQDYLFARKISPEAHELKLRLGDLFAATGVSFSISNEGQTLYRYLTGRGRFGRRFGTRFWETDGGYGREQTLLLVLCKKWHVAKRLTERIRQLTNLTAIDYLFSEETTPLPDLGGIENSLAKRSRHCRAMIGLLFHHFQTDRMLICLDTNNIGLIHDLFKNRPKTRLLQIDCEYTDDFLMGHANRIGLVSGAAPQSTIDVLIPAIRNDVTFEADRIRDAEFGNFDIFRQSASAAQTPARLPTFWTLPSIAPKTLPRPSISLPTEGHDGLRL